MTEEQFKINEGKAKERIERALARLNTALDNYNAYTGNDSAEEHRLALIWQSADAQKVEAERRLNALQAQRKNGF